MTTNAFVFPGQGSQCVGMGAELLAAEPEIVGYYLACAEEASGLPITRLCLRGPFERLTATDAAQPAVCAVSLAAAELACRCGLWPRLVAGHSLGEYTAAIVAGALGVEDGLRLVALRGRLMADVQSRRPGGMVAIIGLSNECVSELCAEAGALGTITAANINTPLQIVCSGELAAVQRLSELAARAGARKVVRLAVGAAFHSTLMAPVAKELERAAESVAWVDPVTPLASAATGEIVWTGTAVRHALTTQITAPVRWVDCVRALVKAGCDTFLELGPGRTLTGLIRQIERSAATYAASSPKGLDAFVDASGWVT